MSSVDAPPPTSPPPVEKREGAQKDVGTDDDDDLDDTFGRKSPIVIPTRPPPPVRFRPSFISNREFVPSLVVYGVFALLVYGAQWMAVKNAYLGFASALVVLAFMAEWERRARYSLGRIRQRAHFDPLNLVKLPTPQHRSDIEMEPPTPWISQNDEKTRTDPAAILKRAQDTIGGGASPAEGGAQSAMELALINLLKKAAINAIEEKDKDKAKDKTADQPPSPS